MKRAGVCRSVVTAMVLVLAGCDWLAGPDPESGGATGFSF